MGTPRTTTGARSERDELEQLQKELHDVRQQREVLPRENAELTTRLAQLEEEVRSIEQARDAARAEWKKPCSSLPEQLVTPFCVTPSRRTLYGRIRFALRSAPPTARIYLLVSSYIYFFFGNTIQTGRMRAALFLGSIPLWFLVLCIFPQTHKDEDERRAWSFDDEGFRQPAAGVKSGKVLYSEVRKVEVRQGWLQRRYGFGSVRVSWQPKASTSLGKALKESPLRFIDIDLLDAPQRLAEWLLERTREAREEKQGGANAD